MSGPRPGIRVDSVAYSITRNERCCRCAALIRHEPIRLRLRWWCAECFLKRSGAVERRARVQAFLEGQV